MNWDHLGTPIFKVIVDPDGPLADTKEKSKTSKGMSSKDVFNAENTCNYCLKTITKPNQAKHIGRCSVIKSGKVDKGKICSVYFKRGYTGGMKEYQLEEDHIIKHIPNNKTERQILYITGRSGSGKSYYTAQYANEYRKLYPKNEIYLFSGLEPEKGGSIESIKGLKRIKFDDQFMAHSFTIEDMRNSLLIFDDIDVIADRPLLAKIYSILKLALETGRHSKTSVIFTTHTACNGLLTKHILNECHSVTIFPKGCGGKSLKYLLDNYFGLSKNEIEEIKALDSRWVTITRTLPTVMFHEGGAKTI